MLKLSHSGSGILKACEKKFFYRYILKPKRDVDAPSFAAANRGSVFHSCWENHKKHGKKITLEAVQEEATQYVHKSLDKTTGLTHTKREVSLTVDAPRIYAALVKYQTLENREEICVDGDSLKEVAWEVPFELKYSRGFIDAVFINEETLEWWMQDKKTTSAYLDDKLIAKLAEDPQVCHYASVYQEIASKVVYKEKPLDPEKFKGFIYSQIKFPSSTRKKKRGAEIEKEVVDEQAKTVTTVSIDGGYAETVEEYAQRLICDDEVQVRNYFILKEDINVQEHWKRFGGLTKKALSMYQEFSETGKTSAQRNVSECINTWGSSCEYWSCCHGGRTFTESCKKSNIQVQEFKKEGKK